MTVGHGHHGSWVSAGVAIVTVTDPGRAPGTECRGPRRAVSRAAIALHELRLAVPDSSTQAGPLRGGLPGPGRGRAGTGFRFNTESIPCKCQCLTSTVRMNRLKCKSRIRVASGKRLKMSSYLMKNELASNDQRLELDYC